MIVYATAQSRGGGRLHHADMFSAANPDSRSITNAAKPYLYRVFQDRRRIESHESNAVQVAYEYALFSIALAHHFKRWSGVEVSCVEQPPSQGGLLLQMTSELPVDVIHSSLSDLLAFFNQRIADSQIDRPRFVMQQVSDQSPRPPERSND